MDGASAGQRLHGQRQGCGRYRAGAGQPRHAGQVRVLPYRGHQRLCDRGPCAGRRHQTPAEGKTGRRWPVGAGHAAQITGHGVGQSAAVQRLAGDEGWNDEGVGEALKVTNGLYT